MRSAIITGGTGLLGSWLIKYLSKDYDRIFAIARSGKGLTADLRIRSILNTHEKDQFNVESIMSRVVVLDGDIHKENLGLSSGQIGDLFNSGVRDVFHSAALAEFRVPYEKICATNVLGTENALKLALRLKHKPEIDSVTFHHIGTVIIAGDYKGNFNELDFDRGQRFNNTYERTKFEAEKLVMSYSDNLRTVIYRPSVITGDSVRGVTTNFKMLYQPVHFLAHELFSVLPAYPKSKHSFVPVDRVAEAIVLLSRQIYSTREVYHLVNSDQTTIERFVGSICEFFSCTPPSLEPLSMFKKDQLSAVQWKILEPFIPYFNYEVTFNAERTNSLLRKLGFCWPRIDKVFFDTLYRYCQECGFVKRLF